MRDNRTKRFITQILVLRYNYHNWKTCNGKISNLSKKINSEYSGIQGFPKMLMYLPTCEREESSESENEIMKH